MPRPSRPVTHGLLIALGLGLASACPAKVEPPDPADGEHGPKTSPDDPRVVKVGEDLYAKEAASNPEPAAPALSLGTGMSDETNGTCRLFAPKFENPSCCAIETGFDAMKAKKICGHDVYLGESSRASCGYFFMPPGAEKSVSFRATFNLQSDAKEAADAEARRLNTQTRSKGEEPKFKVEPVPGVAGAFMIRSEVLRSAFIPGWKKSRQFAWMQESCKDEQAFELIGLMAQAQQPTGADTRPMIPAARMASAQP